VKELFNLMENKKHFKLTCYSYPRKVFLRHTAAAANKQRDDGLSNRL